MSEETLTKRLVEQDAKLERVLVTRATKDDVEHVTEAIDGAMQILRRLDQERIFTAEWVRRAVLKPRLSVIPKSWLK